MILNWIFKNNVKLLKQLPTLRCTFEVQQVLVLCSAQRASIDLAHYSGVH